MLQYRVAKMSCDHCVRAVTEAVHGVDASGVADRIAQAIKAAGYDATLLSAAA